MSCKGSHASEAFATFEAIFCGIAALENECMHFQCLSRGSEACFNVAFGWDMEDIDGVQWSVLQYTKYILISAKRRAKSNILPSR